MTVHYQTFCFSPCAMRDGGRVIRPLAQISCYVYNNGNPEKRGLLPSEVYSLFYNNNLSPKTTLIIPGNSANDANSAVAVPTTVDPSDGGRCGVVGAIPDMKIMAFCISMCTLHSFSPTSQV